MIGKKGFAFWTDWLELFTFILLIIGFIISIIAGSAVIAYAIIATCGGIVGRSHYRKKNKLKLPFYIITIGFLIGYLLGARYGNTIAYIIFFLIGVIISYFLHMEGYLE